MIGAGELDRRITITRVSSVNERGIAKKQAQIIATVWAKLRPVSSQKNDERYTQEQTTAQADFEFVIRWSTEVRSIKPQDRIEYRGSDNEAPKIYELVSLPTEIGYRQFLVLKARLLDANS